MLRYLRDILIIMSLWLVVPLAYAQGPLEVEVTDGNFRPSTISIPVFETRSPGMEAMAEQITQVIRNDLQSSGMFEIKDPRAYIQRDLTIDTHPRFADWRIIRSDYVLVGAVRRAPDGSIEYLYRLWDVIRQEQMKLHGQEGRLFSISEAEWRGGSHMVADDIYSRILGDDGHFDTNIMYVAETGPTTQRVKRLAIMDSDGENVQYLTPGRHMVVTPRYSPEAQIITYMSYEGGRPRVYLFNVENGRQEVLGDFGGMTFAPRFTSDGQSVLLTQAENGNSDIYMMNLRTRDVRRLTSHPQIDTSPSMSPDGQFIVFNSDRGGSPQLYKMRTDGQPLTCPSGGRDTACRITFGTGRYSTPVWSPRGDMIAFTKQSRGKFYIGVIRPDGDGERLLADSYLVEGPEWSPNGRVITYFKESRPGSGPSLWAVDMTGRNERRLPTPTDASDPSWSPPLPRFE